MKGSNVLPICGSGLERFQTTGNLNDGCLQGLATQVCEDGQQT